MMASDLIAKERIAQLMREAEAERLARPLIEARKADRRKRIRIRLSGLQMAFSSRRHAVRPVTSS
jgi:hypothetical protein